MSVLALLLPLLALAQATGPNAPSASEEVDLFIESRMRERTIPGAAVAVIRGGQLVKLGAYGTASLEFDIPVSVDTLFNVASVSKAFTAVAVMRLVEDKRLDLDDEIGSYVPNLPVDWRTTTVRQLLSHTSGLPDIAADRYSTRMLAQTVSGALELLWTRPVEFEGGTDWSYNQTNYMLLGMLIEELSGHAFTEFVRQEIFDPLGLAGPIWGDSRTVVRNRATVYTRFRFDSLPPARISDHEVLDYSMPAFAYAAGGLNISASDFSKWLVALDRGRIINRSSLEALWEPAKLRGGTVYQNQSPRHEESYGLGWVLYRRDDNPSAGGTGGLRAAFAVYPEDDLSVVVLTNFQGAAPDELAHGVAKSYF